METNQNSQNLCSSKEFLFYNASTGRRLLSYLSDVFIAFIISIFIYEIVCFPIIKAATNYESKVEVLYNMGKQRVDLLYDDEVLFYKDETTKYDTEANIDYTGDVFLKFYCFKDDEGVTDLKDDPIIHYYRDIAETKISPSSISSQYFVKNYKEEQQYFEPYNPDREYNVLKKEYKEKFKPYFDPNDTVSDAIKAEIATFKKVVFDIIYRDLIIDYAKTQTPYIVLSEQISNVYKEFDTYYQIGTIISFCVVFAGLFVALPLIDKKGRTLGKIILKLERVDSKNFEYLQKKWRSAVILMNFLEVLPIIMFIPFISVGITNIFNLPILLILSIISILYCIVSLFIAFANAHGRSIKELLTRTIVVDKDLMDRYYREVVYGENE